MRVNKIKFTIDPDTQKELQEIIDNEGTDLTSKKAKAILALRFYVERQPLDEIAKDLEIDVPIARGILYKFRKYGMLIFEDHRKTNYSSKGQRKNFPKSLERKLRLVMKTKPPEGRSKWSLRALQVYAEKHMGHRVSHETIRKWMAEKKEDG